MLDSSFRILVRDDLDRALDSVEKASDFYFCDSEVIKAKTEKVLHGISQRPLDSGDIETLVTILGDEAKGLYQNLKTEARPKDRSYVTQSSGVRYRVALVVNSGKKRSAIRIVMRRLEKEPPIIDRIRLPPGLLNAALVDKPGLVMMVGSTGSGKTTSLAALLRAVVTESGASGHLCTVEDPVEFTFDSIAPPSYAVTQIEIGVGCKTFAEGLKALMRLDPSIILVGEVRDSETAAAVLALALSGHKVFTTMHVSSVPEIFSRWSGFFPPGSEKRAMNELASLITYACYQTLEHTELGFMPVQESLDFDKLDRVEFVTNTSMNLDNLYTVMEGYVKNYGISHSQDRLECNPDMAQRKKIAELF